MRTLQCLTTWCVLENYVKEVAARLGIGLAFGLLALLYGLGSIDGEVGGCARFDFSAFYQCLSRRSKEEFLWRSS